MGKFLKENARRAGIWGTLTTGCVAYPYGLARQCFAAGVDKAGLEHRWPQDRADFEPGYALWRAPAVWIGSRRIALGDGGLS